MNGRAGLSGRVLAVGLIGLLLPPGMMPLAGCASVTSPDERLADALFGGSADGLTAADQAEIAGQLGLLLGADGLTPVDPFCGMPIEHSVTFPDLDEDGVAEVAVQAGNACSAGSTGSTLWLFRRSESGRFVSILMAPALGFTVVTGAQTALPDLELGGPGFCHAVWRWRGSAYQYAYDRPETPEGCDQR
ncbi:MAG: hypothetical protein R3E86_06540 [Pseudomonadales bacterium]